ncbi:hypothetical protein [Aeromonas sp. QDB11]|uniref:hypothetical protein n=1 Tax=Aeromonas sp. QDB11 TaxID=2990482 RepID=UPI0022E1C943|nr:hypothetical protein [Aeromonas sp. QDB11]
MAVQVKKEIGKFYENIDRAPYRTIFNPNTNGVYLWNVVKCLRELDRILLVKISALGKKSGRDYGVLVHGNRLIQQIVFTSLNISKLANDYNFNVNEVKFEECMTKIVSNLSIQIQADYSDKILGTLFKNTTICKTLVAKVL